MNEQIWKFVWMNMNYKHSLPLTLHAHKIVEILSNINKCDDDEPYESVKFIEWLINKGENNGKVSPKLPHLCIVFTQSMSIHNGWRTTSNKSRLNIEDFLTTKPHFHPIYPSQDKRENYLLTMSLAMYICMYVHMYVYMYVCIYVYIYVCMYIFMYVCIYPIKAIETHKLSIEAFYQKCYWTAWKRLK